MQGDLSDFVVVRIGNDQITNIVCRQACRKLFGGIPLDAFEIYDHRRLAGVEYSAAGG
jgi:hypothetical protein